MINTQTQKDSAKTFLEMVASGRSVKLTTNSPLPHFIHHNPYFKGDRESLAAGMTDNHGKFPNKALDIQRVISENDLVAVHSRMVKQPGDTPMALVHIFRFEQQLIAELWDIGQAAPEESPNAHGMF